MYFRHIEDFSATLRQPETAGLTRRTFLRLTTIAGTGLTLGTLLPACSPGADSGAGKAAAGAPLATPFVRVDPDNTVTVICKHMEPLTAVCSLSADRCEIWAGAQFQTIDQMNAAMATGLKPEQVTIHTLAAGGTFGRRANMESDFISEAASIAKATGGKYPVRLIWTREDDITGGLPWPGHAGFDADGEARHRRVEARLRRLSGAMARRQLETVRPGTVPGRTHRRRYGFSCARISPGLCSALCTFT